MITEERIKQIKETIEKLTDVALNLSLKYAERILDGKNDELDKVNELKHINEVKKHLNFAKRLLKEIAPEKEKSKSTNIVSEEFLNKIKKLESSVGDIVRSMPKN